MHSQESPEQTTFKAIPVAVKEDSSIELASPTSLELSSDSDRSIERIYNLRTGKVFAKVGTKLFNLNTNKTVDENHNSTDEIKLVQSLVKKFIEAETIDPPEQFRNNVELESMSVTMDFSLESEDKEATRPSSAIGIHTEILDLRDRQLVKSRLGQFSKSHPNLSTIPSELNQSDSTKEFSFEKDDRKTSVHDLRKLFDQKVSFVIEEHYKILHLHILCDL